MLQAILNKSWRQHITRHQLYGHLPPITKTIQVRRTRHAGHCWRSRDELISDVLLWTPTHGREKAGRPARTYIQQLCEDTGCYPEDLPEAMNDREKWRERVRDIRDTSTTYVDNDLRKNELPVVWGYRILRKSPLQKGKTSPANKSPGHDTKQSVGEALELWEMGNLFIAVTYRSTLTQKGSIC